MNAKDVIRQAIGLSDMILNKYVDDLEDANLYIRPVDGMNCIAWQLGHLVSSERGMVEGVKPGSCPALPEGFEENHTPDRAKSDDTSKYLSKNEYVALIQAQRVATKAVLDGLSESELDAPSPERMRSFCPTVGSVMMLTGTHYLMHLGQFVAVRRKLNKPVAM
jgi:hypothetical protein